MISHKAQTTAERYYGAKAREYDARRRGQPKWRAEDAAVRDLLADLPPETTVVLDIPVGTGRFIPLYEELGFRTIGLDISSEMLAQARKRVTSDRVHVAVGDIFAVDLADAAVDITLVIRFCNLIEAADLKRALGELQRVTRETIAFTLRVGDKRTSHYHSPHEIETVEAALAPGWRIAENKALHQLDYRLVVLRAESPECSGSMLPDRQE